MCGIVGYSGNNDAADVIMRGLFSLEYRGYDSAGIALCTKDGVAVYKIGGRLSKLAAMLAQGDAHGSGTGIGHTRWATHGEPCTKNAHPHRYGKVTLVHNGIIENYREIREYAESNGAVFISDTDTEAAAYIIDLCYDKDPFAALSNALLRMRGSYAFGIIFDDEPDAVYAVRRDSPLIAARGEKEAFIASDIPAVLPYTRDYYVVSESDIVRLKDGTVRIYDMKGNDVTDQKQLLTSELDPQAAEKNGYPHFMKKEIYEQPEVLRRLISKHLQKGAGEILSDEIKSTADIERIRIVGCGSAMHAGLLGKYAIEHIAKIPVDVCVSSEFRYNDTMIGKGDTVIVISQSGETADTVAAMRQALKKGARVIAIVNATGSTICREADEVLYTYCGPEIAVATTKAFTAQVLLLYMLAARLAYDKGAADRALLGRFISDMKKLPEHAEKIISPPYADLYDRLSVFNRDKNDCYIIGRGQDHAAGCEAAMKIKEVSYIHCEAYPAGELKHGTISLITQGVPCIAIITDPDTASKTLGNIKEVRARGGAVLLVSSCAEPGDDVCEGYIRLPSLNKYLMPLLAVIPLQLYAYYTAYHRGCDIDKPRNLAKSVTVE